MVSNLHQHYHKDSIFDNICHQLRNDGVDLSHVKTSDLKGLDEMNTGALPILQHFFNPGNLNDSFIIDIGCGLGGNARWIAQNSNSRVVGIDQSRSFVEAANQLSQLTGLEQSTSFILANALDIPLKDGHFDHALTVHTQMNIWDKRQFYAEAQRVIKKRGYFLFFDIFLKSDKDLTYPLPWANNPEYSFLQSITEAEDILQSLGFQKVETVDQTSFSINNLKFALTTFEKSPQALEKARMLKSTNIDIKIRNLVKSLENGSLNTYSGIFINL